MGGLKIEGPMQSSFQRSFSIPCTAEEAKINVEFSTTTGKLIVTVPKRQKREGETDEECEQNAMKSAMAAATEQDEDPFAGIDDILGRSFGPPLLMASGRSRGFLASNEVGSESVDKPKPLAQPT